MKHKDIDRIARNLEEQGCTVRPIKPNGYRILHPNGTDAFTLHQTGSDHRGLKNLRAQINRSGLTWPDHIK